MNSVNCRLNLSTFSPSLSVGVFVLEKKSRSRGVLISKVGGQASTAEASKAADSAVQSRAVVTLEMLFEVERLETSGLRP